MQVISDKYLTQYQRHLTIDLDEAMSNVKKAELKPDSFTFYTSVAVISSSRIEGEQMELDSYVKHKMQHIEYLPELTEKPNDLYQAYLFAKDNTLNGNNFLQAHKIISQHLLPEKWRGVYRKNEMLVMEHKTGNIQFEAAPYSIVEQEMNKLWSDVDFLLKKQLSLTEVFYYASFIHMVFVNIHPFNDANGRTARLLEKWFLAEKLGDVAWYIPSERYYYEHVDEYYKNLNRLGIFYDELNYDNSSYFLQMLPSALA